MFLPFRLFKLHDKPCFGIFLLSSWEILRYWFVRHGPSCSVVDPPDQPLPQRRPRHAIILNTCDANLRFCLIHLFLLTTHRTAPGMFMEAINLN